MADVFAPGVEVIEKESFPAITGPGASFSGILVRSPRGPDNVLTLVGNIDQYLRRYGGASAAHPYGYESVKSYFDKGGDALYVGRVVGAGAAAATKTLVRIDNQSGGSPNAVVLNAASVGAWANSSLFTTTKWATKLDGAMAISANTAILDSVTGVEIGDVVYITDGVTEFTGIVTAINVGTRQLTFRQSNGGTAIADDGPATCTSYHKAKTTLAAAVTGAAPTQLQVASAASIAIGDLLLVIDPVGSRVLEAKVTAVNGNILAISVVTADGSTTIPSGSVVVSTNFQIVHVVDGATTVHANLALESENPATYAPSVLAQTEYLRATAVTGQTAAYRSFVYPKAYTSEPLAGGLDGSAPVDTDYLGTTLTKTYTHGIKLFDSVGVLPQFGIPNASSVVKKAADQYAQARGDTFYVFGAAQTNDTLDELLNERNVTLNLQSSYSGMYAPWVKVPDPLTPGAVVAIPPEGDVLGVFSETAQRRGTHKAPANELVSGNVQDVTAVFSEAEFALLNTAGVNLIRNVSGRGIRVAGGRTQWPNEDRKRFVNVRRVLNSVKIAFRDFGVQVEQEPNDDLLWQKIDAAGKAYLRSIWESGWLFPRKDPTKAFFFVCDATTNTEALRLSARVRAVAGVNPVLPGELIRFELALYDGGQVNINEL